MRLVASKFLDTYNKILCNQDLNSLFWWPYFKQISLSSKYLVNVAFFIQSDRKVAHITVSNIGLLHKLQDIQHLQIMFITLHPNSNKTMSLQHMLEMGSLFSNACASPCLRPLCGAPVH
jgi:hypothetical protein